MEDNKPLFSDNLAMDINSDADIPGNTPFKQSRIGR